jgi:TRAP transporter 4TM/12TM fusion protein
MTPISYNLAMRKEAILNFLKYTLGEEKAAITFPHPYMQFFGLFICAIISLVVVVIALGAFPTKEQGYITMLILVLMATFLLRPKLFSSLKSCNKIDIGISLFLVAATILVGIHFLNLFQTLGQWEWLDNTVYIVAAGLIIESVRRFEGKVPILFVSTFLSLLFYFLFVDNADLFFSSDKGLFSVNPENKGEGVYGKAFSTIVDVVYTFIFFSFAFHLIKINKLLNYLAFKITHGRRSGASSALYAIWASGLYGMISGAARGSVVETGENTIPTMKQAGYPAEFSASVQAIASSVAQIFPPIMGVIAFVIVEMSELSYLEVMFAALIPAFLFIFSLRTAVKLEARRLALKPLNLKYTTEHIKDSDNVFNKQILYQLIVLVVSFVLFFTLLSNNFSLALCALSSTMVILLMAYLFPPLRPDNKMALLSFIIDGGKKGLQLTLSCAAIGMILFVFKQTAIEQWITDYIQILFVYDFFVLLFFAFLPILLGIVLPTIVVYFLVVFMSVSVFHEMGIPELHTYLFVFYYSILAGITPPNAPLLKKAAKIANIDSESKKLYKTTFKLSIVIFILPLAWIYHPEIILDSTLSIASMIKSIYIVFALMVAIVAISAGLFGLFRSSEHSLSMIERLALLTSGGLIVFSNHIDLMVIGVILASFILVHDDWKKMETSRLRPAFSLAWLVITPKNISFSVISIFVSLILVYIAFFIISGLSLYLSEKSVTPWLTERFHFTLAVKNCDVNTENLQLFLQKKGYRSTIICSKFAEITVSKVQPGEIRLQSNIHAVEFQEAYFDLLPNLKQQLQENYDNEVQSPLGSCLEEISALLKEKGFNLNEITSSDCLETRTPLPIVYLGADLASLLEVSPGALVHLHDAVFAETLQEDMIMTNPNQHFVVAAIFKTAFPDINNFVIGPTGSLSNILDEEEVEHKLAVKIHGLKDLGDMKQLWEKLGEEEMRYQEVFQQFDTNEENQEQWMEKNWPYENYYSITHNEIWKIQNAFLNSIHAMSIVIFILCLLILLSGISQLMENNKKLVILMRLSGIHFEVMWIFLFILSIMGAIIPCLIAFLVSMITSKTLVSFFDDVSYIMDSSVFFTVFGITLLTAVCTTFFLSQLHLSRDIAKEWGHASRI